MIEPGSADSLVTGLLFLLNGAGAVLIAMRGRYKVAAWVSWALMLVCLGAFLEGLDVAVPWPPFVEVCFAIWAFLFALIFVRAAQKSAAETEPRNCEVRSGRGRG